MINADIVPITHGSCQPVHVSASREAVRGAQSLFVTAIRLSEPTDATSAAEISATIAWHNAPADRPATVPTSPSSPSSMVTAAETPAVAAISAAGSEAEVTKATLEGAQAAGVVRSSLPSPGPAVEASTLVTAPEQQAPQNAASLEANQSGTPGPATQIGSDIHGASNAESLSIPTALLRVSAPRRHLRSALLACGQPHAAQGVTSREAPGASGPPPPAEDLPGPQLTAPAALPQPFRSPPYIPQPLNAVRLLRAMLHGSRPSALSTQVPAAAPPPPPPPPAAPPPCASIPAAANARKYAVAESGDAADDRGIGGGSGGEGEADEGRAGVTVRGDGGRRINSDSSRSIPAAATEGAAAAAAAAPRACAGCGVTATSRWHRWPGSNPGPSRHACHRCYNRQRKAQAAGLAGGGEQGAGGGGGGGGDSAEAGCKKRARDEADDAGARTGAGEEEGTAAAIAAGAAAAALPATAVGRRCYDCGAGSTCRWHGHRTQPGQHACNTCHARWVRASKRAATASEGVDTTAAAVAPAPAAAAGESEAQEASAPVPPPQRRVQLPSLRAVVTMYGNLPPCVGGNSAGIGGGGGSGAGGGNVGGRGVGSDGEGEVGARSDSQHAGTPQEAATAETQSRQKPQQGHLRVSVACQGLGPGVFAELPPLPAQLQRLLPVGMPVFLPNGVAGLLQRPTGPSAAADTDTASAATPHTSDAAGDLGGNAGGSDASGAGAAPPSATGREAEAESDAQAKASEAPAAVAAAVAEAVTERAAAATAAMAGAAGAGAVPAFRSAPGQAVHVVVDWSSEAMTAALDLAVALVAAAGQ